jgi:hemerythrin-like domain-containing protein
MALTTNLRKAGRKLEAVMTGTETESDLLDTLKDEHEDVKNLLQELLDAGTSVRRKALLKQVKQALVPHARAEEKVLYDAIIQLRDKKASQDGEEGYIEHHLVDRMIADLSKITNAMSVEFSAGAKVLKELLEHHIREEEGDVWSDAREHFSLEQRQKMNARYLKTKPTIKIPA